MADKAKYIELAVANGVTHLGSIKDAYNTYAEGGYMGDENHPITLDEVVVTPQSSALARSREATGPNTDFMTAMDLPWRSRVAASYFSWMPGIDPHTCINTVTGFYDPENTVASNPRFADTPEEFGYNEIDQSSAVPGDIIILSNGRNHPTHAVMFDSIAEEEGIHNGYPIQVGDTLVNYSNGGRGKNDYRIQGPLRRFDDTKRSGGDFSGTRRYFRYNGKKKKQ